LPGSDEPLTISVASDGRIYIQETLLDLKTLPMRLAAISKNKKDTRIFVRGDRTVDYGRIMLVVAAINEAGFSKVALVTEQTQSAATRKP
jgi:biopolymer transport protein TolR